MSNKLDLQTSDTLRKGLKDISRHLDVDPYRLVDHTIRIKYPLRVDYPTKHGINVENVSIEHLTGKALIR